MINLRYTIYILAMKLPPIGPIRIMQERIQDVMNGEVEQMRRELQFVRWQANQAHMELLDDPNNSLEKKEELRKIDQRLSRLLDEYVTMSRYRISDE